MKPIILNGTRIIVDSKLPRRRVNKADLRKALKLSVNDHVEYTSGVNTGTIVEIVIPPKKELLDFTEQISVTDDSDIYGRYLVVWDHGASTIAGGRYLGKLTAKIKKNKDRTIPGHLALCLDKE